ncbi:hypothetical protein QN277_026657 [Acacia crassicarpa]|uniref:Glycosyltransferase n=1 Tax=Acacia crassicarpa TaxID=499986 RepID=A0AAE1J838_9FABA|nr:hypothetical protein QN277_026657 [Acacia crassicarpa]
MAMESCTMTKKLEVHFILIPLMSAGHVLPIVDLAKLLGRRNNVKVTIMTTPVNAVRVGANIDREIQCCGSSISVQPFRFPSVEAGLPEGCESSEAVPCPDLMYNFAKATTMLQKPVEEALEKIVIPTIPTCFILDKNLPFLFDVAKKFKVPIIISDALNCFSLLCNHNLFHSKVYENVSESESFVVPGLPHRIVFKKYQLQEYFSMNVGEFNVLREKVWQNEGEAFGVLVNSFQELEEEYVKEFTRLTGHKVYCVGPLSLVNKEHKDKAQRGKLDSKEEEEEGEYLRWLDSWPATSVIFANLGSLTFVPPGQVMEIILGLEASKRPFIWVLIMRDAHKRKELNKLLKEDGVEERVKGRGLIIRGWVPQILILSHTAIGAFLTHCGWNSTLEGITSGVPLITFPLTAEQFYNEKVAVQLLETGVRVGVEKAMHFEVEDKSGIQVRREKVKEAIEKVMGEEDEESKRIRERAGNYREKANKAMEKGGSSYLNLSLMIEDIKQHFRRRVEDDDSKSEP